MTGSGRRYARKPCVSAASWPSSPRASLKSTASSRSWRSRPLVGEPSLKSYHLLPAVRGDLLRKLGRSEEARAEFERAASLTENLRERELLQKRAAECAAERMAG